MARARLLILAALLLAGCLPPPPPPLVGGLVLPEALCLQGGALYVADPGASALWRLSLGERPTLEQVQGEPVGADFVMPGGMVAAGDGSLLVTGMGRGLRGLVRAGPGPGFARVDGSGVAWRLPLGVALDGRRTFVADQLAGRVVEVDLATGARRPFGPEFRCPSGLALEGDTLWVSDPDAGEVVGLDKRTGARSRAFRGLVLPTAVAAPGEGVLLALEGGGLTRLDTRRRVTDLFVQPSGLASDGRRAWVSDPALGQVIEVDLATGRKWPVAVRKAAGATFQPEHVAVLDGGDALVTGGGGLHRLSLRDGTRSPVPAPGGLVRPFGLALLEGRPILTDPGRAAVMTPRGLVSAFGKRGRGPRLVEPEAVAVRPGGKLAVSDIALGAVLEVDEASGDRTLLTGPGRGAGDPLEEPSALAPLGASSLAVADLQRGALLVVDPATGDRREVVSGLKTPGALVAAEDGLYVADDGRHAVFEAVPGRAPGGAWSLREVAGPTRGRGPALEYPSGLARLPGGHLLVADHRAGHLLEVRPEDGDRRVVEPELESPGALLVEPGRALVADSGYGGLLEVDLATGRRQPRPVSGLELREPEGLARLPFGILVSDLVLRGLARLGADGKVRPVPSQGLARPSGLAVREGRALVADSGLPGLMEVDLQAGTTRRLDRSGPEFVEPQSVVATRDGAVVADPAAGVFEVDGAGNRRLRMRGLEPMAVAEFRGRVLVLDGGAVLDLDGKVVSRWGERGQGPPLLEPGAAVQAGGDLLVADAGQGALFRVDPDTGDRKPVSQGWPVAPTPPANLSALAPAFGGGVWMADATRGLLLLLDRQGRVTTLPDRKVRTLVDWGGRVLVADLDSLGSPGGPRLYRGIRCEGLADAGDGTLLATDRLTGRLYRLHPQPGPPRLVAPGDAVGPRFLGAAGVAMLEPGHAAVLDERQAALFAVDLSTGKSSLVSGPDRGTGPEMEYPSHVTRLPDGSLAVSDEGGPFLLRVDPATGDRTLLSGAGRGEGPALRRPRAVLAVDGRILLGDAGLGALLEVDPATGDRRILWRPGSRRAGLTTFL